MVNFLVEIPMKCSNLPQTLTVRKIVFFYMFFTLMLERMEVMKHLHYFNLRSIYV